MYSLAEFMRYAQKHLGQRVTSAAIQEVRERSASEEDDKSPMKAEVARELGAMLTGPSGLTDKPKTVEAPSSRRKPEKAGAVKALPTPAKVDPAGEKLAKPNQE